MPALPVESEARQTGCVHALQPLACCVHQVIPAIPVQKREAPLLLRELIPQDLRMVRVLFELLLKEREQPVIRVDELLSIFASRLPDC